MAVFEGIQHFIDKQKAEKKRLAGLSDSELISASKPEQEKKQKAKDIIKRTKRMTGSALSSLPSLQDNTSELIKQIGVLSGSSNN